MKITHRIPWALPYGYTEVEFEDTDDFTPDFEAIAAEARSMEAAVVGRPSKPAPEYPDDPGPQEPARPTTPRSTGANGPTGGAPAASSTRVSQDADGFMEVAPGERVTDEHFACPDCGHEAKPSVEKYQQWETGKDGRVYRQKWFCGNDACATKSLWRSKLVPLATAGRR